MTYLWLCPTNNINRPRIRPIQDTTAFFSLGGILWRFRPKIWAIGPDRWCDPVGLVIGALTRNNPICWARKYIRGFRSAEQRESSGAGLICEWREHPFFLRTGISSASIEYQGRYLNESTTPVLVMRYFHWLLLVACIREGRMQELPSKPRQVAKRIIQSLHSLCF